MGAGPQDYFYIEFGLDLWTSGLERQFGPFVWDYFWTLVPIGTKSRKRDLIAATEFLLLILHLSLRTSLICQLSTKINSVNRGGGYPLYARIPQRCSTPCLKKNTQTHRSWIKNRTSSFKLLHNLCLLEKRQLYIFMITRKVFRLELQTVVRLPHFSFNGT